MNAQVMIDAIESKLDRVKYHGDAVTLDDLEHILEMARDVQRDTTPRIFYDEAVEALEDIQRILQDLKREGLI